MFTHLNVQMIYSHKAVQRSPNCRVARQFSQEKAKHDLNFKRTKKIPNTFLSEICKNLKFWFEKEPNKKLKPKNAKKSQKWTKKAKRNILSKTLSKRTRFEMFGFNEAKLATLIWLQRCSQATMHTCMEPNINFCILNECIRQQKILRLFDI